MSTDVAQIYASQDEDRMKLAQAELFGKLAAANNINLDQLNDTQVQLLWDSTFPKTAEFPPGFTPGGGGDKKDDKAEGKSDEDKKKDEEKKEEEKKEAAAREHEAKLAQAREVQNAYNLGEVMAQGWFDHLQKLGMQMQPSAQTPEQLAAGATKEAAMPDHLQKAVGKVRGASAKAAEVKPGKMQKKASPIDDLALEEAMKIAHDAGGYDLDWVSDRVIGIYNLDLLKESTKLASTVPEQVRTRALEFLEAAGLPVNWGGQPAQ